MTWHAHYVLEATCPPQRPSQSSGFVEVRVGDGALFVADAWPQTY